MVTCYLDYSLHICSLIRVSVWFSKYVRCLVLVVTANWAVIPILRANNNNSSSSNNNNNNNNNNNTIALIIKSAFSYLFENALMRQVIVSQDGTRRVFCVANGTFV